MGADIADKCLPQLNHQLIDFMSWIAHGEPGAAHRPLFHSKRPLGSAERSQTSTRAQILIEIKIFFFSTFKALE